MTGIFWTAQLIEDYLVEAVETLRILPDDARGPKQFGNSMPTPVRAWQDYGREPSRYIKRATPAAIDRMMETWKWLNAIPYHDRVLLAGWAEAKATKGKSVQDFASQEGIKSRTLRWTVSRLCQGIADMLNTGNGAIRHDATVDAIAEILAYETPDSVPNKRPEKRPTSFMEPGAKPYHDSSMSPKKIAKEIEAINKQRRKERRLLERRKRKAAGG